MSSSLTYCHELRVSYAECTVGNHVYYSRYLDYLEVARGEFLRNLQMPLLQWQAEGCVFPVIEAQVRYRGAARYDDRLRIELWVAELQRIKVAFGSRILNQENRLLVEATTVHVCTDLEEKPRRLPEPLVSALQPYLRIGQPAA